MNDDRRKALDILAALDPGALSYDEWLRVGMVCKEVGVSLSEWDAWSARDGARYKKPACAEKWSSFRGNGKPVGMGSLVAMACDHGVRVRSNDTAAFDWNDRVSIGGTRHAAPAKDEEPDAQPLFDERWVEPEEIPQPTADWAQNDIHRYLEAMFEPDERVGLVFGAWQGEDGRWLPHKGVADRTRMELQQEIKARGLDEACGDTHPAAGAWVRINPLDGEGFKDVNVVAFRHSLIEADDQDLGKQLALIRKLNLPCSAIVHSGGKSIHALVRVEAADATEYRDRVDRLYKICEANGLKVDRGCRNPSRLSRLPGVMRGGRPQYLIDARCGAASWDDWERFIDEAEDDLPDPVQLSSVFFDPPALAPEIIEGILREGHKMRLTGPSKAGKSFALIELAVAMAEGKEWLGAKCRQGPVLYINLELDPRSCFHRFIDVYRALGWPPDTISAIDIWNLRGAAVPLDKLAPKLIRRGQGKNWSAIIFDPIYKLQWGDENDAGAVAKFCNDLDRISHELGAAVIDAHHHSKGAQGQKRSIDRGSGSGVFGRDPDAILDMIELDIKRDRRDRLVDVCVRDALTDLAGRLGLDMGKTPPEEQAPASVCLMAFQGAFPQHAQDAASTVYQANRAAQAMTGWRVEATLREFATPDPRLVWFGWPVHFGDRWELLKDAKAAGEEPPWEADREAKQERRKAEEQAKHEALEAAIDAAGGVGRATVKDIAESLGKTERTIRDWIKANGYGLEHGKVVENEA